MLIFVINMVRIKSIQSYILYKVRKNSQILELRLGVNLLVLLEIGQRIPVNSKHIIHLNVLLTSASSLNLI